MVVDIAKYFEPGQTSSKKQNALALKDNNTTVCQTQSCDKLPVLPNTSTPTNREPENRSCD